VPFPLSFSVSRFGGRRTGLFNAVGNTVGEFVGSIFFYPFLFPQMSPAASWATLAFADMYGIFELGRRRR